MTNTSPTTNIMPGDFPALVFAVRILGIYPTPKAALIKAFSLSADRAKKELRQARGLGFNGLLLSRAHDPDSFFGVVICEGQYLALRGRRSHGFETLAEAEAFANAEEDRHREQGKPKPEWLFLEKRGHSMIPARLH